MKKHPARFAPKLAGVLESHEPAKRSLKQIGVKHHSVLLGRGTALAGDHKPANIHRMRKGGVVIGYKPRGDYSHLHPSKSGTTGDLNRASTSKHSPHGSFADLGIKH